MEYKFEFKKEEEKHKILQDNSDKFLIKIEEITQGNFLTFSDIPTLQILQQEQGEKISILEAENKAIKEELSITQDAVNELIFNSLNI